MDVRMRFGRYEGQIVDLENESALAMLKDGRAENPYLDAPLGAVEAHPASSSAKPADQAAGKKAKSRNANN